MLERLLIAAIGFGLVAVAFGCLCKSDTAHPGRTLSSKAPLNRKARLWVLGAFAALIPGVIALFIVAFDL